MTDVTYDDIRAVRLIIGDPDTATALLDEESIVSLIELNGGAIRLAAADALDAIAASEVLVSKKIRTQTLSTDGPAVSAELRALAAQQRALHAATVAEDDLGVFDVVDTVSSCRRPELTEHECWGL